MEDVDDHRAVFGQGSCDAAGCGDDGVAREKKKGEGGREGAGKKEGKEGRMKECGG